MKIRIIAKSRENLDSFMSDWRNTYMEQSNPTKLAKIRKNIEDLCSLLNPSDSLLDVGCGEGTLYGVLGHEDYHGVDISDYLLRRARMRFPEVHFTSADLFGINGEWDVILCSRVLMHVSEPEKAIETLKKSAKKNVVLFVPVGDFDECVKEEYEGNISYFRTFSENTLKKCGVCDIRRHEPYSTVIYG